jgi:hypothetical protein
MNVLIIVVVVVVLILLGLALSARIVKQYYPAAHSRRQRNGRELTHR